MKEKNNLPTRSDTIYSEVESFEDYEYTNCIAYEMAIRNNEAIRIVKQIKKIIDRLKSSELEFDICAFLFSEMNSVNLVEREEYEILNNKLKLYGFDYSQYIFHSELKNKGSFLDASLIMVFSLSKEKIKEILDIEHKFIESLQIDKKEKFAIGCNILKGGYKYQEDSKTIIKDYFKRKNLKIDTLLLSRPELKFDSNIKSDISLNLALPKDELIAYISKIKYEYDKDNSIIKGPLELIGEDLSVADENLLIHKGTGKYNKQRVADMFYIYDCDKLNIKKSKIINELNYYYYDKDTKNTNFTYDTLNKYLGYAKSLIDDLKYKELITGAKITN